MKVQYNPDQVNKLLNSADNIALITVSNPTVDQAAALLGFSEVLKREGKKTLSAFSGKNPQEITNLKAASEVEHNLGVNDLLISFDLKNSPIDKVSYYLEDHTFNLLIRPEKSDFSIENVRYSYRGPKFDLLVVLDAATLEDLGELYRENQDLFEATPILNISTREATEEFGAVNIVDSSVLGISELFYHALAHWDLKPNPEAAKAFLTGISSIS